MGERERRQLQMARDRQEFENEAKQKETWAELMRSKAVFENDFEQKMRTAKQSAEENRQSMELELERSKRLKDIEVELHRTQLSNLAEMARNTGLDVTAYLCAQAKLPVDQRIEILGDSPLPASINLHSKLKAKL